LGLTRFYFYSHKPNEPPHIHIDREDFSAKFWLEPVTLVRSFGFLLKNLGHYKKWWGIINLYYWRHGMGILALAADERVKDVHITEVY